MTRQLGAELFKLRTTRTFYGLTGGAIALVLLISLLGSLLGDFKHEPHPLEDLVNIGGLSQVFALVLGILAVTSEYRHGTITPSLLAVPERARLIFAKLAAALLVGLVLGLVCIALVIGISLLVFSARGIGSGASGSDVVRFLAGNAAAAALYGAFGVGLGAVVRNQVGAVVGVLVWTFVLEPLLGIIPGLKDVVPKYGLVGVGNGLSGARSGGNSATEMLGQVPAGLVFAAYCAIFLAVGIALVRRRDVSA